MIDGFIFNKLDMVGTDALNKISVIIPLYNKQLSIKSTVQSVLEQTFTDFEIILVDDGSTDKSLEQVRAFNDDRIKIITKDNGGVSTARNVGILNAKYHWIAFLDGDDLWLPNHLETLHNMILIYPKDKVFCTSYRFSSSKEEKKGSSKIYSIKNYFKAIQIDKNLICSSCALVHKSCFDFVGGFNETLTRGEDLEMWYRLGKAYNFIKSDTVTAIYRLETENRAMSRNTTFEESFASVITFKDITNLDEKKYLKNQISAKFKSCLYRKEWTSLCKLILRFNLRLI